MMNSELANSDLSRFLVDIVIKLMIVVTALIFSKMATTFPETTDARAFRNVIASMGVLIVLVCVISTLAEYHVKSRLKYEWWYLLFDLLLVALPLYVVIELVSRSTALNGDRLFGYAMWTLIVALAMLNVRSWALWTGERAFPIWSLTLFHGGGLLITLVLIRWPNPVSQIVFASLGCVAGIGYFLLAWVFKMALTMRS